MVEITSKTNSTVMSDAKLLDKKARDLSGLYVVEGHKMLEDAIKTNQKLLRVYVDGQQTEKYAEILRRSENAGAEVILTTSAIISKLTDAKTPQGIVAVLEKRYKNVDSSKLSLLMENLQDPKNVGSLLRTACAAGIKDVFVVDCADVFGLKSVRASMSGIFYVNIHDVSFDEALDELKNSDIVVGDMSGQDVFQCDFASEKVCIAVGNEGNGISDKLKGVATRLVKIPMDCGIESLNVSVAGSILMYAVRNKRKI